jgi:hypothetical protein
VRLVLAIGMNAPVFNFLRDKLPHTSFATVPTFASSLAM